jgi:hypothetical protein
MDARGTAKTGGRGNGMSMEPAQVLWEIEQIKQLKARYLRLLDTKAWDEWRELFTDDMRFWNDNLPDPESRAPISSSGDAFVGMISGMMARAVTVHQGYMPEIELTGERTARGIWAMYDWVDNKEMNLDFQGYGHYHETYEKGDDGRWRIKSIHLTRVRAKTM